MYILTSLSIRLLAFISPIYRRWYNFPSSSLIQSLLVSFIAFVLILLVFCRLIFHLLQLTHLYYSYHSQYSLSIIC